MLTQTKVPDLNLVPSAPDPDADRKPRRLSDILQEIADAPATPDERISLGHLIDGFGNRAFGALLFIFALPVALPIAIPGISAVLGAPLLFLSWQLMRGRDQPWLPELMRSRSFRRIDFARMLTRVLPWMRRLERLVGPRLILLVSGRGERVIGFLAFVLALILFLPIPFGNTIPGLAIALLALAVLERDGAAAIAGTLVGLAGIGVVSGIVLAMIKGAVFLLQSVFLS
ncbi:exopolysaccharide biosynthesis protein [Aurantimonas sp. A3-2-R12]|uniref:exopolysaccharide biosynthesis protein n=1 Tax=Aurantimonas sp. A3-2-R12 TaxID=3114362 RepID=UPI002E176BB9|nr:exopolysaccharide biosynthesis protein [Aurantimonas sp. A3-2-R12]